ncbi:MAG TPA: M56 family metallopeptidase [Candidatus Dormibacteraeota bacterium]|nr:M56 family metallopeptidase [Candidatus Dormibacteraeota bacterium]
MNIFSVPNAMVTELLTSALRGTLLAAAAGLGLAAFRVRDTSVRLFVWRSVLYGALAIPFFGLLLPPLTVPTPALWSYENPHALQPAHVPQTGAIRSEIGEETGAALPPKFSATSSRVIRAPRAADPKAATQALSRPDRFWSYVSWNVVVATYFLVALILLLRLAAGFVISHRVIRRSQTIAEPRVAARLASRAYGNALAAAPRVAESDLVSVPVTVGTLRSTILLPATWREWDDAKLDAVLAHEVSHVARGDALTQRLSLLHRAIFWFSPLAWWLDRHLATLAEQASDEAALSCGADRNTYARTLLGFFEALQTAPGRVWWQGVSMAKAGQAEQRLEKILAWRGAVTMNLKKSVSLAIIAVAVPVVYLVAAVRPAGRNSNAQEVIVAPPPAAPATPQTRAPRAYAVPPVAPAITGVVAPPPPAYGAPVAPAIAGVPPSPAWAPQARGIAKGGFSYGYGFDDDERYVIVSGKTDSYTMSGSTQDIRHVEKLKKEIPGDFIWFQRDEKSYIIRDQATIDRAKKLWAPQEELGKKQEELGAQQEALGKQQEELAEKMEQVKVNVPDMTAALDKLKAKLQKLGPTATMEQIGDLQSEIGDLQSKIGDIQSQAGDAQSKLGEQQGELGEKQGKLGELQGELGEQQGKLAEEASRRMKELLDEAVKNGTAKPEAESVKTPTM